jgi:hypothetical protein
MPHARAQRWWSAKIIWVHRKQIQKENHILAKQKTKNIWVQLMKDKKVSHHIKTCITTE